MAPKNNSHGKTKGDKKKKEEKVLPAVLEITVNLPDEISVVLKEIRSTNEASKLQKVCQYIGAKKSISRYKFGAY